MVGDCDFKVKFKLSKNCKNCKRFVGYLREGLCYICWKNKQKKNKK